MVDIVDKATRSRMMAGIKGKNTKPELIVRRALHAAGFRFRLHATDLPGKPDLVFPKFNAVIFVNGCFWHGHGCQLFKWPTTQKQFWREKIKNNRKRDSHTRQVLQRMGWRTLGVWECAFKGKGRLESDIVTDKCVKWLLSRRSSGEIQGKWL